MIAEPFPVECSAMIAKDDTIKLRNRKFRGA